MQSDYITLYSAIIGGLAANPNLNLSPEWLAVKAKQYCDVAWDSIHTKTTAESMCECGDVGPMHKGLKDGKPAGACMNSKCNCGEFRAVTCQYGAIVCTHKQCQVK